MYLCSISVLLCSILESLLVAAARLAVSSELQAGGEVFSLPRSRAGVRKLRVKVGTR